MKLLSLLTTALLLITFGNTNAKAYPKIKKVNRVYTSHYENVLGTSLELKIAAGSQQEASAAEAAVLDEITRMNNILSGYDANSEFRRWEKTFQQPVRVSRELFEVLSLFDKWRIQTGGALDASAEVVTQLWKQASAKQQVPTPGEIATAIKYVQTTHWKLDPVLLTATHTSNAPLMLNSFAKSYIIRHAAGKAMSRKNVKGIIVNIGGDMVVSGNMNEAVLISDPKADAENEDPVDELLVNNRAVATSGNYRRGELINGQWYSHIVDPRTGQPSGNIISATVVAPSATDAGALATAFNVMAVPESVKLAAKFPGTDYLIITKNGERITSPGWSLLEIPAKNEINNNSSSTAKEPLTTAWGNDFELVINLEIRLQQQGFVKRPYVAIWVEDENHTPVRTITVWHGSDRYLNELKSWYLKYRDIYKTDKNFNTTVTSATRSAGKYTVKWDGKDDQGNFLKPVKYFIKIEAAREHGTYQLMRQEIECDETPKVIDLPGNVEIASATIDYRKKTTDH